MLSPLSLRGGGGRCKALKLVKTQRTYSSTLIERKRPSHQQIRHYYYCSMILKETIFLFDKYKKNLHSLRGNFQMYLSNTNIMTPQVTRNFLSPRIYIYIFFNLGIIFHFKNETDPKHCQKVCVHITHFRSAAHFSLPPLDINLNILFREARYGSYIICQCRKLLKPSLSSPIW